MDEAEWFLVGLAVLGSAVVGAWLVWNVVGQPAESPKPQVTYRNVEEWTLKRDTSGRLTGVDVHRKEEKAE